MSEHAQNQIFFLFKPSLEPQQAEWQQQCPKGYLSAAFCHGRARQQHRKWGDPKPWSMWWGRRTSKESFREFLLMIETLSSQRINRNICIDFFYFHQQKLSYSLFNTWKSWNSHFPLMCISKYLSVECLREFQKHFCFLRIILFKIIHCIFSNNFLW